MSCLTTSATRRSRRVAAAVLIASAAASSQDVPLVPLPSVPLYPLMTLPFRRLSAQARAWHFPPATSRTAAAAEHAADGAPLLPGGWGCRPAWGRGGPARR